MFRLWAELSERYPHFEFLHGHGLGVLGVGAAIEDSLQALFDAARDPAATAAIREVFWRAVGELRKHAALGEKEGGGWRGTARRSARRRP